LPQVFVSRNKELDRLGELLSRALEGHGQVAFVTGEAGFGKTSLTLEFARRAQQQNQDLLVAIGDCNSQTGIGDPYLPFRELLRMLTGEFADRVASGATTQENANRLRDFLRISKAVVGEVAPDLIDLIVPGAGLATKAGVIIAGNRKRGPSSSSLRAAGASFADASPMAEQGRIFEQVTAVLVAMAAKRPLILVLDDLQWIDDSSASLMFHLARRIEGSRILIVGTYRPEDVALGRARSAIRCRRWLRSSNVTSATRTSPSATRRRARSGTSSTRSSIRSRTASARISGAHSSSARAAIHSSLPRCCATCRSAAT
jgi:predicted ATPase